MTKAILQKNIETAGQAVMKGRVLFVSPTPTHPQNAGNRVRIFGLLKFLQRADVPFHFVWIMQEGEDWDAAARMKDEWGASNVTCFPHRYPRLRYTLWQRLHRKIASYVPVFDRGSHSHGIDDWVDLTRIADILALAERFQPTAVCVEYVFFSKYLEFFPADVVRVVDTHDVFSNRQSLFRKSGLPEETAWFSTRTAQERMGLRRADRIIAIQDNEQQVLRKISNGSAVATVGHLASVPGTPGHRPAETPTVLIVAGGNGPNRHGVRRFLAHVWPRIRRQVPDATCLIAGTVCRHLPGDQPGTTLLGFVQDLGPLYAKTWVVAAPVYLGTGLKIKCIEALSHGIPVVTPPAGAAGLESHVDSGISIATSDRDYAAELCRILDHGPPSMAYKNDLLNRLRSRSQQHGRVFLECLNISAADRP